ncbi:galactofuranosylgalactofuranosylrhamnosyl-N-acetylglucosaminyl-diphospho-decaprenol beta-1,5/1,6-galactofuranosyltransferase [Microbacterium telephonicum]|uniref:Galactofuranosylgalactofuranosylrhamnosyl-N-acetylglucosaminyl-diphospho-decaprenol beta-1,5/1,6-galactofuranosyltransferase n=1 Tax=Microbacterium telephonicum TaxID=1714841 RepID=A0A498BW93_9MICO|nr:galactofuranosylgalactofuranosylrhamnosyl-N-acetylglucosaminyl-diphospho-decaprenol beta-1,5/1,6-galactofuranosyltransferase [Microbacterium telephonicum]
MHHRVARVVLPVDGREATVPLYLDGGAPAGVVITGRRSVDLRAGATVSFGSYFNAFPAAYWQRDTGARTVRLTVRAAGGGTLRVWRSDAAARATTVRTEGLGSEPLVLDLPLSGFDDGGAYWFDLTAGGGALRLDEADWSLPGDPPRRSTVSVGMTTFNRPVECLSQLRQLADDGELERVVRRIFVIDQGDDLVADQPGFAEVAARLGDRLHVLRQRNIGGSGGFSRAMSEALAEDEDAYVVLLDDDAVSEPESLLRAVAYADNARGPLLVGGGMLHLDDPGVLYTQSEQWDKRIGWVCLDRDDAYDHDFARAPFRDAPAFHQLQRSDFNGWWMCLIPLPLLRDHGLSWPLFIKGDDVEFGRRAAAAGVPTVSVPGIAVWHLGWRGKAPTRSWEAYYLHRNRLIGELLHAAPRRPLGIMVHSLLGDLKPLLGLQYGAVRLRALAISDVLAGPDVLPGYLDSRLSEVRALRARFPDGAVVEPQPGLPPAPEVSGGAVALLRAVVRQFLLPVSVAARRAPQAQMSAERAGWPVFSVLDSALVQTADGEAVNWFRRSRRASWRGLARSLRLHAVLWLRWPALARAFRSAARVLTSDESWRDVFAGRPRP